MSDIKKLQRLIEDELSRISFPDHPDSLYEPVRYSLSMGGKRMRPLLVLLACDLFNGNLYNALHPALGIEVFHNFTLLHDDIMDNASLRRTQPTVHVKWNASTAILSGDAMFVKAVQLIMQTEDAYIKPLLNIFTETALMVCEGQQLDMDYESAGHVTIDEYLHMIKYKTAVLLGCSLQMGAIVAGASVHDAEYIYEAGKNLGMAFQLQDDLLDLYADEGQFGKTLGGDIVSNKKTFLLLKALEVADAEKSALIQSLMHDKNITPEKKIAQMRSVFDELEIASLTEEKLEHYYTTATEKLQGVQADDAKKQPLIALFESLRVRVH